MLAHAADLSFTVDPWSQKDWVEKSRFYGEDRRKMADYNKVDCKSHKIC